MKLLTDIIGSIAALCTTLAFVPQVLHIVKTKDTKAISLKMYLIFIVGIFSWLVYGLLMMQLPLILANTCTLILASVILYYKLKYD